MEHWCKRRSYIIVYNWASLVIGYQIQLLRYNYGLSVATGHL